MSLERASLLAQVISAMAVVASLIFVGIQLNQATKAVRASSSQAHSAMYHAIIVSIIEDPEIARIWQGSLADLDSQDPVARIRFIGLASSLFRFYESSRRQWLAGQLDEAHWHTIEQQAISLKGQPGIRSWWALRRHWHSDEFQRWFEALPQGDEQALYGQPAANAGRISRSP